MKGMGTLLLVLSLTTVEGFSNIVDKHAKNNSRIIDGVEAVPHSFPYQVGMFIKIYGSKQKTFCGGSLLNDVFILTAAHCVHVAYEAEVILGAHNIHELEPTQQRFITKLFIVHKGWNSNTLINDIAIVRLPRSAKFTENIQPVRLPTISDQSNSFAFETATISGWGTTVNGAANITSLLRFMQSTVTPPLICKLAYFGRIGENQMCVDGYKGISICKGDSGGPLVLENENGERVQHGIVSFGIGFGCDKRWPQVFTKVSMYLGWIHEHTALSI